MVSLSGDSSEDRIAEARIQQLIQEREARRKPAPLWLPVTAKVLPYVLIVVTLTNLTIGAIAAATPFIASWFGDAASGPIYSAYSYICPQRPDHTFFLAGHPMAFEQRDLSMYVGFGIAGLLYLRVALLRRPLSTGLFLLGVAPLLIDVAISTVEIRPSTAFSRLWTGALASLVIVWWSYPRFDAELARVRKHAERILVSAGSRS